VGAARAGDTCAVVEELHMHTHMMHEILQQSNSCAWYTQAIDEKLMVCATDVQDYKWVGEIDCQNCISRQMRNFCLLISRRIDKTK